MFDQLNFIPSLEEITRESSTLLKWHHALLSLVSSLCLSPKLLQLELQTLDTIRHIAFPNFRCQILAQSVVLSDHHHLQLPLINQKLISTNEQPTFHKLHIPRGGPI